MGWKSESIRVSRPLDGCKLNLAKPPELSPAPLYHWPPTSANLPIGHGWRVWEEEQQLRLSWWWVGLCSVFSEANLTHGNEAVWHNPGNVAEEPTPVHNVYIGQYLFLATEEGEINTTHPNYDSIQHIFIPACSVARKTPFMQFFDIFQSFTL